MKKHYALLLLIITQLLLLLSLVLLIVCLLTSYWIKHEAGQHIGLLEYCEDRYLRDNCQSRESILLFRKIPPSFPFPWPQEPFLCYDFDVIAVTIIISIVSESLALLASLCLCCSVKGRKRWRVSGSVVTLLSVISVVFDLVGIAHFEGKKGDSKLPKAYEHGWSAIVAWTGFGVGVVATVFSLVVSCVDPDDHSKKPHSVRSTRSSGDTRDTWPCSRENKSFEDEEQNRDAFFIGKNDRVMTQPAIAMQRYGEYSPRRGTDNRAYHTDYHSDYRPSDLIYDPRNRTKKESNSRRRPSIEIAYSSGGDISDHESGKRSKRHTYSSGYPNSSDHPSRRYTSSTEEGNASMSTTGYDPRTFDISPYAEHARPPPPAYKPPRSQRLSRYPNIGSDGYQIR